MSEHERDLATARLARDAARATMDERIETVRAALSGQSIGQRLKGEAKTRAWDTADEALDLARESRWVIGSTLALLLAWIFRNSLMRFGDRIVQRLKPREQRSSWRRLRNWIDRKAKL